MLKNLTSSQLLLVAIAAIVLLLAAFSFFLLKNPSLLPQFSSSHTTPTSISAIATSTDDQTPSETPLPTRRTTYTPFARLLTPSVSAIPSASTITPVQTEITNPTNTTPSQPRIKSATLALSQTPSVTVPPTSLSITASPTITATLLPGEYKVTGRVIQNGTPVANVIVEFEDDIAARKTSTDPGGHYFFSTLAPGTAFTLTFNQSDNPQMKPASDITFLAWINGTLSIGVNPIDLPDFEVSLNLSGLIFELLSPMDGATYSASVISSSNPIQFIWSLYSLSGSYTVELGAHGSNQPLWTSSRLASTNSMWNGVLNDGTHITQGSYWWRVAVTKSLGNYIEVIYTQPWDILFNP